MSVGREQGTGNAPAPCERLTCKSPHRTPGVYCILYIYICLFPVTLTVNSCHACAAQPPIAVCLLLLPSTPTAQDKVAKPQTLSPFLEQFYKAN